MGLETSAAENCPRRAGTCAVHSAHARPGHRISHTERAGYSGRGTSGLAALVTPTPGAASRQDRGIDSPLMGEPYVGTSDLKGQVTRLDKYEVGARPGRIAPGTAVRLVTGPAGFESCLEVLADLIKRGLQIPVTITTDGAPGLIVSERWGKKPYLDWSNPRYGPCAKGGIAIRDPSPSVDSRRFHRLA